MNSTNESDNSTSNKSVDINEIKSLNIPSSPVNNDVAPARPAANRRPPKNTTVVSNGSPKKWLIAVGVIALLVGGTYFLIPQLGSGSGEKGTEEESVAEVVVAEEPEATAPAETAADEAPVVESPAEEAPAAEDSVADTPEKPADETAAPAAKTPAPAPVAAGNTAKMAYGTYTGHLTDGEADGIGSFVFSRACTIDLKDGSGKTISVKPGDKIINAKFRDGYLRQGEIVFKDGSPAVMLTGLNQKL